MAITSTTIQGDPTGSAAPVSGTVTANIGTTNGLALDSTLSSLNSKVTAVNTGAVTISTALPAGSNVIGHIIADSGSTTAVTGNVTIVQATGTNLHAVIDSGTITSNIGTTNGLALDASVTGLQISQGSTTSGQKGGLTLGAVTTAAPTYSTAQSSPLSLTTAGALRIDGSATTQPVSGTVTANAGTGNFTVVQGTGTNLHTVVDSGSITVTQATAANLNATVTGTVSITANSSINLNQIGGNAVVTGGANGLLAIAGPVASGGANADNPVKIGAVFNTTQPTVTNGQIVDVQATARGAQIVSTGVDTFNVTINAALPTGANTIGAVTQASGPWSINSTQINGSAIATAATGIAKIGLTDGAGTSVTVGQKIMASSLPVAIASDQASFPITLNATTANKTKVMKTGTLVTTAVTADQVVLTYTVTAAKTFYVEYVMMDGYVTTQPGNTNPIYLGAISLETPSGTKVITEDKFHTHNSPDIYHFSDPLPVAAGVVIRVVTTPAAATSFTWRANFGGYEV